MMQFYSIGEFYEEIARGLRYLHQQYEEDGRSCSSATPAARSRPNTSTPVAGNDSAVTDLDSALAALAS